MKISLKWLQEYVDVTEFFQKPEELGEALTRAGLEVEETTNRAKDFQHVVVGHILEKDKHPNADKLSLCRVSTGNGMVHQIVCGAQN
ncbi:MAG: phenylalanine--tRNA ligase subunit beta, partial [Bdellovibrio sp.]